MSDMARIIDRLVQRSVNEYYNPYQHFEWPPSIDEGDLWMSEPLISVYGTPIYENLDRPQKLCLAKWESVNFYSMNVHGIRELLLEVVNRVHVPGFEEPSRFFHHFIGEENEHMYFFAKFCTNYGGKIYPTKKIKIRENKDQDIENIIVFSRILIFEEIVDFYNKTRDLVPCDFLRRRSNIAGIIEAQEFGFIGNT